ncbi:MAG: peptidoglycan editing factor PgeF [Chloracidobacterium sp.]|nr:peptidoglycan editing factor PgeF [Chloracidobacterium sp.]
METIIPESHVDDSQTLADSGFFWREAGGIKVLVSRALESAGFVNGFSTRHGGVSAFPENSLNLSGFDDDTEENILENRRRFLAVFPGKYSLALALQVHGVDIRVVTTKKDIGDSEINADAVMSSLNNVLAAAKTADCVPVLIGDTASGAYAAVHAGWRGTAQLIVKIAIDRMRELYGSQPADLACAIGPAACGRTYEVGPEVVDVFVRSVNDWSRYFTPTRKGHALVDLHACNRDQLISSGVRANSISIAPFCTIERSDLFFSYRREKGDFGRTGRLLSVIGRGDG